MMINIAANIATNTIGKIARLLISCPRFIEIELLGELIWSSLTEPRLPLPLLLIELVPNLRVINFTS
jgi:hypothetical protein